MIDVQVVRGDSPEAVSLVAAMEAWVAEGFGPPTPDRTSTVMPREIVPPGGAFVVPEGRGRRVLEALERAPADLGYRRARLDTAPSLTGAVALYESAGYRRIPDYNGNRYASLWGEKEL
jgi:hypothetical protein